MGIEISSYGETQNPGIRAHLICKINRLIAESAPSGAEARQAFYVPRRPI